MENRSSTKESEVNMKVKSKIKEQKSKLRNFKILNLQSAICNSQDGMVLIVSLLLLLVATVMGITALSTSTTNVMIAGNQRLKELNFAGADSGIYVSDPIIDDTAYYNTVATKYADLIPNSTDFLNEINGTLTNDCPALSQTCTTPAPDIQFDLDADTTVYVDVDYLYAAFSAGSAIEFASGYEGLGKSAAGGGVNVYYGLISVAQSTIGSEDSVCAAIYKYVTR